MTKDEILRTTSPPSKRKLVGATFVALVVAAIILFTIVLPAEYGIDPLKTGAMLGLIDLSEAQATPDPSEAATGSGKAYTAQPSIYKVDSRTFTLKPKEGIEFKYHMDKGAVMLYGWQATGFVQFEFHGEPDKKPNKDYYDSYEKDYEEGDYRSYGSFTAPSTGIHGWYWENKTSQEVTVRLTTSGFYDNGVLFGPRGIQDIQLEDAKIPD